MAALTVVPDEELASPQGIPAAGGAYSDTERVTDHGDEQADGSTDRSGDTDNTGDELDASDPA
jgi:hypothetical protein